MPHFTPALLDLNDPAANAQRAEFVAVLAEMSHQWSVHTVGITGFATVLCDDEADFDAETRREFYTVILNNTQNLRQTSLEIQWAAQLLSGVPLVYVMAPVDLRDLIHRAIEARPTTRHQKSLSICWNQLLPVVHAFEPHLFSIFSALVHHGQWLAQSNSFAVTVEEVPTEGGGKSLMFSFCGNTDSAEFTDPDEWFAINQKSGSESIRLYLARELALMYGGRVWVETANKTQFDFRLSLPVKQEATND